MSALAKAALGIGAVVTTGAIAYGVYRKVTSKKRTSPMCGRKYDHLVITASGYTLDEPGSDLPFVASYDEWYELAQDLALQAHQRFSELGQIECEATGGSNCLTEDASGGDYPRWNALVPLNNRMTQKLDDLSSPAFAGPNYGFSRSQAQSVIKDAICLMEQADEGIESYGGKTPVTPTPGWVHTEGTPTWQWVAFAGAAAAAVGGIAYGLSGSRSGSAPEQRPSMMPRAARPQE